MKNYRYTVSTSTIWTSFDYGIVKADNEDEAREKAEKELKDNFALANKILAANPETYGMTVEYAESQIEIEETDDEF